MTKDKFNVKLLYYRLQFEKILSKFKFYYNGSDSPSFLIYLLEDSLNHRVYYVYNLYFEKDELKPKNCSCRIFGDKIHALHYYMILVNSHL